MNNSIRNIPSINLLLEDENIKLFIDKYGKEYILNIVRDEINNYRTFAFSNSKDIKSNTREEIIKLIIEKLYIVLDRDDTKRLKKVINATGIILHTNLGRAPLSSEVLDKVKTVSEGYSNLEYDLVKGTRGSRTSNIEQLLVKITGAEAALVVNNNAAAVFICLNSLANNQEVVVSRGEQVEIGGSFRIPDIISRSGCKMIEVGTTNKTHTKDYESVINEGTKVLLKVHTSNFKIQGFTKNVELKELVKLGKEKSIKVFEDLGSGTLIDMRIFGLNYEPMVQDSVKSGADVITFSGDKLLGGAQAGIIIGKKESIDKIRNNPLMRMIRMDKMSIIVLETILRIYLDKEKALKRIPLFKMLSKNSVFLEEQANILKQIIEEQSKKNYDISIIKTMDNTGGGSLPCQFLEGRGLKVKPMHRQVNQVQKNLRCCKIPIVCKIEDDSLILNLRTIESKDYELIGQELLLCSTK